MPIFEYQCQSCEVIVSILMLNSDTPSCDNCGGDKLRRLISRTNIGTSIKTAFVDPVHARPSDFLRRPESFEQTMHALGHRIGISVDRERMDNVMHRLWKAKEKCLER
jgi:putative FmdB family regulatory protein